MKNNFCDQWIGTFILRTGGPNFILFNTDSLDAWHPPPGALFSGCSQLGCETDKLHTSVKYQVLDFIEINLHVTITPLWYPGLVSPNKLTSWKDVVICFALKWYHKQESQGFKSHDCVIMLWPWNWFMICCFCWVFLSKYFVCVLACLAWPKLNGSDYMVGHWRVGEY